MASLWFNSFFGPVVVHLRLFWNIQTKWVLFTPPVLLCDEYFWEIKEDFTTEKTDIKFHSFDHALNSSVTAMFIWCVTCTCYFENFPIKMQKKLTVTWVEMVVSKWACWYLLCLSMMNTFSEVKENIATEKTDMKIS